MRTSTLVTATRVAIIVAVVGVVVVVALIARELVGPRQVETPRTEGERTVMVNERAVEADPDNAEARAQLGAAYLLVGRHADALRQAEHAVRLAPEDGDGYLVMGMVHRALGRYDQAVESITRSLEFADTETAEWRFVAQSELSKAFEGMGDLEGAMNAITQALAAFPEAATLYYDRARILEQMGDLESALRDYEAVLTFLPDDADAVAAIERVRAALESAAGSAQDATPAPAGSGAQ